MTFVKLINDVVSKGLSLCNYLNLKNQLKKQRLTVTKELGQFCNQFGSFAHPVPTTSVPRKRKLIFLGKGRHKGKYKGQTKDMQTLQNQQKPKSYKIKLAKSSSKSLIYLYCGKISHTRNHC